MKVAKRGGKKTECGPKCVSLGVFRVEGGW